MIWRIVGIIVVAIVVLVGVVLLIGWRLPVAHRASREAVLPAPADSVFAAISHSEDFPRWRSDVKQVETLPPENGHARFREIGSNGTIEYRVEESVPGRRIVTRIADRSLPFGGAWTHELTPVDGGTRLRITEDGEIYNPLFRFVSRYVVGYTASMDRYLADLRRRLGGT